MSDWFSALIIILIVVFIVDGLRRARRARQGEIRLSANARKADEQLNKEKQEELERSSVFPSGGARQANLKTDQTEDSSDYSPPQQESLNLDDPVPMLMESVVGEETGASQADIEFASVGEENEPSIGALDKLDEILEEDVVAETFTDDLVGTEQKTNKTALFSRQKPSVQIETPQPEEQIKEDPGPSEILIINVMAKAGEVFLGQALFDALMEQKLRFGQMDIFHRHQDNDGDAPVVYSIANIIEPGKFDFAKIKDSQTPGVTMFLTLPTSCDGKAAYEDMVTTAKKLAHALGGELKDENRSALTNQTIEHGRQRVMELERQIKLKKS